MVLVPFIVFGVMFLGVVVAAVVIGGKKEAERKEKLSLLGFLPCDQEMGSQSSAMPCRSRIKASSSASRS